MFEIYLIVRGHPKIVTPFKKFSGVPLKIAGRSPTIFQQKVVPRAAVVTEVMLKRLLRIHIDQIGPNFQASLDSSYGRVLNSSAKVPGSNSC